MKLLIAGDGGQGVQTMADIISQAAFNKNLFVSYVPNYGLEQRGGASLAFIQISDREVAYPKFTSPDILLIMSGDSRARVLEQTSKSVRIIDVKDYLNVLEQNSVGAVSYNVFFLGVLAKALADNEIDLGDDVFVALEKKLGKKPNWEENKRVYSVGNK